MRIFYILTALTFTGLYAAQAVTGWEFGNPERRVVPAADRRSPGWMHSGASHSIWFSGYRGGK